MSNSNIVIESVTSEGRELRSEIRTTSDLRRFFSGTGFQTSYDVDIDDVPDGILSIPVLAHVCPVAWTQGADVYVEEVDETFARALEDVRSSLCSMYEFFDGGEIHADRTIDVTPDADGTAESSGGDSGLLFTGGIDSMCSYVRHREEQPTLISVRGWTIDDDDSDDEKWRNLRSRVSGFADERDLETAFLESNMLSFLDHPMLLAHYKRHVPGGWYSAVGAGLGLLGLCAPMAHARGIDDLYIAASGWEGIDLEWGSHPDIDENVRWGATRCHHDAYELTRQERIDAIAEYVRESDTSLQLQTCNYRMDGNCGRCEKCYRTAIGLRLSGLDPNDHGYAFEPTDYPEVRASFESGEWVLGADHRYHWADIRNRTEAVDPASAEERAFFAWLQQVDLETLVDESGPPIHHRMLRAGARNVPDRVYSSLYPIYQAAKSGVERHTGSKH